jgi:hypothetical protein
MILIKIIFVLSFAELIWNVATDTFCHFFSTGLFEIIRGVKGSFGGLPLKFIL